MRRSWPSSSERGCWAVSGYTPAPVVFSYDLADEHPSRGVFESVTFIIY